MFSQCVLLAGGSDYQEIRANTLEVLLTFDNNNRQQSFDVVIIDDPFFEFQIEDFILELRFDPFQRSQPSTLILSPNTTTVEIINDEGIKLISLTLL